MVSRCLLILLDGLGDRSCPVLANRTPLQAARTPNLDRLARLGANGLFHAARPGIVLPSENAHFHMFGYKAQEFPGRGLFEALGAGIPATHDDVFVLAHMVTLKQQKGHLKVMFEHPKAPEEECTALARAIQSFTWKNIDFRFTQTHGPDGIVRLKGRGSPRITDSDPMAEGQPLLEVRPVISDEQDENAVETAEALNGYLRWCYERLEGHPINIKRAQQGAPPLNGLVTQRAGAWRLVEPFTQRWGLKAMTIASGLIYWGLGEFLGFDVHKVSDTQDPGSDLAERLRMAHARQGDYQFMHVHTKAPDAAAHTKDPYLKLKTLESLDEGIGRVIDRFLDDKETIIIVTSDHSTPSIGPLIHSGEPVPMTVVGPGVWQDQVQYFDEIHCAGGALGQITGGDFMPMVLNYLDRAKLRGIMDTPIDQPYWPGCRRPLVLDIEND